MSIALPPTSNWRCISVPVLALFFVLSFPARAQADDATPERARLAAALRQLDALERTVAHGAARSSVTPGERYHFDYPRLQADLARVRAGIQAHLMPSRAQPRDPSELAGDYRTEQAAPPPAAEEDKP